MGLAFGFPPWRVWLLAVGGNLLPVPFLLWGTSRLIAACRRIPWLQARLRVWEKQSGARLSREVRRWGILGLALFVAVPLPGTGAWTGAVASSFLGLPWGRSLLAIAAGVMAAGGFMAGAGTAVLSLDLLR